MAETVRSGWHNFHLLLAGSHVGWSLHFGVLNRVCFSNVDHSILRNITRDLLGDQLTGSFVPTKIKQHTMDPPPRCGLFLHAQCPYSETRTVLFTASKDHELSSLGVKHPA